MRSLAASSALALLGSTGFPQGTLVPSRIESPIIDRGVYHVATGTFSQRVGTLEPSVIYNNSAPSGYFFGSTPVWQPVDHGRIPSRSSSPIVGTRDLYVVDAFSISYCSSDPASVDQVTMFFDAYEPCSDIDLASVVPVASFVATGLPGGTTAGGNACWVITFDLSASTMSFSLAGDADGTWDDVPNMDGFGWLGAYPSATPTNATGPVIAGNCAGGGSASVPPKGFGTDFAGVPGASDATGLGTDDFFWIDANGPGSITPNANGGCFFFGGCNNLTGVAANPWSGFWLQVYGSRSDGLGQRYCSSLVNESGGRAMLTAEGTDPSVDLVLVSTPVPNTTGQFCYGPMMLSGMQGLGDGLRCVGGSFTRRMLPFVHAGRMGQPPNTATLAVSYTAPYASGLTGVQNFQHWFRSGTSAGTGSNTSDAISITF